VSERSERSALVTGGAGGLGGATVARLRADGWEVVVLDRVDGADVTDDGDVQRAVDEAVAQAPLRLLVNVAGGGVGGGPVLGHDRRSFERTLRINVVGTFNASRLAARAMAANERDADGERGVIVHTSSVSAFEGQTGQVAYAAAKAAIAGMTLPMARDLAPVGIRVCTIAPGTMATPALLGVLDSLDADPAQGIPFPPRLGRPEEFADLVAAIVANPYLNGEVVRLDGAVRLAHDG
jgi:NAD(P)-dependent dehydrogenase (short-subunit alcohol dehydrogenase family)